MMYVKWTVILVIEDSHCADKHNKSCPFDVTQPPQQWSSSCSLYFQASYPTALTMNQYQLFTRLIKKSWTDIKTLFMLHVITAVWGVMLEPVLYKLPRMMEDSNGHWNGDASGFTGYSSLASCWDDSYDWYVWFKYDLGRKYHAPQVRPDQGSNMTSRSWQYSSCHRDACSNIRPSVTSLRTVWTHAYNGGPHLLQ